ncbi:MAG: IclR family transcriptional regulator, partial [Oscillibacter sp.]
LATLLARGYAFKSESSGKYCLSLRMFELGSQVVNSCGVLSVTRPLLDDLFTAVGGTTIHLVLWENSSVTYIYKNDAPTMLNSMQSHVGMHAPMYCTGVGKSILALLPKEQVKNIWEHSEIQRFTPTTITTLDGMYAELKIIREQGYAVDNEEHEFGIGCVAAAIRNCAGSPIAAVSISGLIRCIKDQ